MALCLDQEAWLRLSAFAVFFLAVRTIIDAGYRTAVSPHFMNKAAGDPVEGGTGHDALAHAGLIGNDNGRNASPREAAEPLQNSREKDELIPRRYVAEWNPPVDDPVAVEQDKVGCQGPCPLFEWLLYVPGQQ